MKSTLLFFGRLSDRFGRDREVDIPETGCTVAELKARLAAADPEFAETFSRGVVNVAIDQQMADDGASVKPGQEIAFFSPLSGG
jgi:molybdopterin synthase sulfur carrier subunit